MKRAMRVLAEVAAVALVFGFIAVGLPVFLIGPMSAPAVVEA